MSANTSSVNWLQSGSVHLRVYSSDGVTITERCWDGSSWTTGAFKQSGQVSSATAWFNNGPFIRVYCTNAGVTTEYCWDNTGPWYKGAYTG